MWVMSQISGKVGFSLRIDAPVQRLLPNCSLDLTGLSAGHEHSDQHAAPVGIPVSM